MRTRHCPKGHTRKFFVKQDKGCYVCRIGRIAAEAIKNGGNIILRQILAGINKAEPEDI